MTAELVIRAIGTPAPQGSFFAIIVRGRAQVVADNKATGPWRKAVKQAAENAMRAADWLPLNEATEVQIVFVLPRPAAAKGRAWPAVRPDLDKYVRSTFDALTEAKVIADDSRIVKITAEKVYGEPGQVGARILVRAMSDQGALV
jgi:Holliday junction resolvase RusA-like endonuclease